jgi:hypothetical protein
MKRFLNGSLENLDPAQYFGVYSGGKPMVVSNYVWDAVGNRYLMYTTEDMPDSFVQVIYHVPSPPFWLESNPQLANISQGSSPTLGEPA